MKKKLDHWAHKFLILTPIKKLLVLPPPAPPPPPPKIKKKKISQFPVRKTFFELVRKNKLVDVLKGFLDVFYIKLFLLMIQDKNIIAPSKNL